MSVLVPELLIGSQDPTHRTTVAAKFSRGQDAVDLATMAGLELDPWQQNLLIDGLGVVDGYDATGTKRMEKWAAYEVGVELSRQNGKALCTSTPILTARGWTTMAAVQVGDRVYHPSGRQVAVTAVSDTMHGHDCCRVTTTDGRTVIADAAHLWTVTDKRTHREVTVTTQDLVDAGLSKGRDGGRRVVTDGKSYLTQEYRWALPRQSRLESPAVVLPLDPYLLGGWLGNGSAGSNQITVHVDDAAHWAAAIAEAGYVPTTVRTSKANAAVLGATTTPAGDDTPGP